MGQAKARGSKDQRVAEAMDRARLEEIAANARKVNPHLLGGKIEAWGDLIAVDVQPLCGDIDVDAALAVFQASDECRFMTGLAIPFAGGWAT